MPKSLSKILFFICLLLSDFMMGQGGCVIDTDSDGVCDEQDLDDDNDGVLDADEGLSCESMIPIDFSSITNAATAGVFTYQSPKSYNSDFGFIPVEIMANLFNPGGGNDILGDVNGHLAMGSVITDPPNYNNGYEFTLMIMTRAKIRIEAQIVGQGNANFDNGMLGGDILNIQSDVGLTLNDPNNELTVTEESIGLLTVKPNQFFIDNQGTWSITTDERTGFVSFKGAGNNRLVFRVFIEEDFCESQDTDGDGTPDHLDTDSDGDGCADALEGNGGFVISDLTGEVLSEAVDANGVPTVASGGQTDVSGRDDKVSSAACDVCVADNDNDGVCDDVDLDDDNDGILDEEECPTAQVSTEFETSGGESTTFEAPAADRGFEFYIYALDNSFNLEINGVKLVPGEIQCQGDGEADESKLLFAADNWGHGHSEKIGWTTYQRSQHVYNLTGTRESPVLKVVIDENGDASIYGKQYNDRPLELMKIKDGDPQLQNITWNKEGNNTVVLTQRVVGATRIKGEGFGVQTCNSDVDGDGILDHLDTDSDGDGCFDAKEGSGNFVDADIDGEVLAGAVDANGVPIVANGGQTNVSSTNENIVSDDCELCTGDNDNDGVCDNIDLDDDNDGILDTDEGFCSDSMSIDWTSGFKGVLVNQNRDNLGEVLFTSTPKVKNVGTIFAADWPTNAMSDGVPGIHTVVKESGVLGSSNTPVVNIITFPITIKNPILLINWASGVDNLNFSNTVGLTGLEFLDNPIGATIDGLAINSPNAADKITDGFSVRLLGAIDEIEIVGKNDVGHETYGFNILNIDGCAIDTDGDEIPNHLDSDSDNDGCFDALEGNGDFDLSDITEDVLSGAVDVKGVPISANGGQEDLSSTDGDVVALVCEEAILDTFYVCFGDSFIIEKANKGTGIWEGDEPFIPLSDSTASVFPTQNTVYTFRELPIDNRLDSFVVLVDTLPRFEIGNDTSFCSGEELLIGTTKSGTYSWNTGVNTGEIIVDSNGLYILELTDGNGCISKDSLEVTILSKPIVALGNDTTICFGDTINIASNLSSGSYLWSNDSVTSEIGVSESGVFWLKFEDFNGCSDTDSINVSIESLPIVSLGTDTTVCLGEIITLDAGNSGLNFRWNNDSTNQTIEINKEGVYGVEVTSGLGCLGSDSIEFFTQELPVVNLGNDTIVCDGNSVTLDAGNTGLSYSWNTGGASQAITLSTSGIYGVEVIDEIGCLGSDSIELTVNPMPDVNLGNDTSICKGESVTLDAQNSGFEFKWNSGETTQEIFITTAGEYSVEVFDSIGCADTSKMNLTVNELPVVNLGNDTIVCDGESVTLNAENIGLNYLWNTTESTQEIILTTSGVYGVEVTDEIGCMGSDSIELTVNPMPVVNLGNDTTICKGESVTLNAQNNGFDFKWNTGETTQEIVITTTGEYEVEVFDSIGCADTSKMILTVNELPAVDLGNDTIICEGEEVNLDAENSGLNFVWNTGDATQEITINETGFYGVEVTDAIGCLGSDSMSLTVNPMPEVSLGNDTSICIGESVILDAGNTDFNFKWSTGEISQTITVEISGDYAVEVFDSIGCADTSMMTLTVNSLPEVNLGADTTICEFESLVLDAENPGLNYEWSNGLNSQIITISEEGAYWVKVSDEIGCLSEDEIIITKEIIEDPFLEKNHIVCEGVSIVLEPDFYGGYNISWEENPLNSTLEVKETGLYTSYVEGEFCTDTFVIDVHQVDTPMAVIEDLGGKSFYCFDFENTTLRVESDEDGLGVIWSDFGRSDEVEITGQGVYDVVVSNEHCESRFQKEVSEYCSGVIFVPNAFTPGNRDGQNDIFKPVTNDHVDGYEFLVFNRWGQLIFSSNNPNEGWDGTYNGSVVQMDVYTYQLSYNYISDNGGLTKESRVGRFSLIK